MVGICQAAGREAGREVEVDGHARRSTSTRRSRPAGIEVVETDLGEYIIQLAGDRPSHIIAPGHPQDAGRGRASCSRAGRRRPSSTTDAGDADRLRPRSSCARGSCAPTWASPAATSRVAETGTVVLVTNEGNGRMVTSLPRGARRGDGHGAGRAAPRPTWPCCCTLLARAAHGPDALGLHHAHHRPAPAGRGRRARGAAPRASSTTAASRSLGTEYQEMLHCIRCGACLNVCPVYRQIGGHAYGWVYCGPDRRRADAAVQAAPRRAGSCAHASSLCGACDDVCPVEIPLHDLLLGLRRDRAERRIPGRARAARLPRLVATPGRRRSCTG